MATRSVSVEPLDRQAPRALAPVFEAQRDEWRERLDWDLTEISEMIAESVEARALAGSVLVVDGLPCGYGFYVPETSRVLVGEIYVAPGARSPAATGSLVADLLGRIEAEHPRMRIESQSVHFDAQGLEAAFASFGFARAGRTYMRARAREEALAEHRRVEVRSWRDADYDRAVEVIYQSYRGGIDAKANSGYRTREGCADLMDALVGSAWCGMFDEELTQVAVDRDSGRLCGVAVASTISDSTGHLGQISVLPLYQGEGVGRALVTRALLVGRQMGLAALTLAVTDENASAVHLYRSCGFEPVLAFPVYYRDPRR